ncbi:helix-turn-helix domain-containing protein [Nocardia sp. NPDC051990]|uniref:TetR/AcrR family transcriptional regulator n=1 Tax=Nocardia sp. NPDC051990 TaxID=3155285 RepID=UPI00343CB9E5
MATRAQIQERNRRALLRAAIDLIAARGYRDATVEAIAARADLTTGAVYSCFGGKQELFYAAIAYCRDELMPHLDLDLPPGCSASEVLHRYGTVMADAAAAPDFRRLYLFELELTALVLHDPRFADRVRHDGDPIIDTLTAALTGRSSAHRTTLDEPSAQRIATAATALARGLLQGCLWRDIPIDATLIADACSALASCPR